MCIQLEGLGEGEYTTVLLYPESSCEGHRPEVFIDSASGASPFEAAYQVQCKASQASNGLIAPHEFAPLAVFVGDVPLALNLDHFLCF